MEGIFAYSYSSTNERDFSGLLDDIKLRKKKIKVCSLSTTFDCHLLWAHYAAGFTGMAIEVELPDRDSKIKPVTYEGVFASVNIENETIPAETAKRILSSKYVEWKYEEEVRILNDSPW